MTRCPPPDELNGAPGTGETFRQKIEQRLVGRGIDGRGADANFEFVADRFPHFVLRGARLKLDRDLDAIHAGVKKSWSAHNH